jgi:hypothetical protein
MTLIAIGKNRVHVCSHVDAFVQTKVEGRTYQFEFSEGKIWAAFEAWQATSKWARKEEAKP